MKPIRNRFFCVNAGRTKMKFETKEKADRCILFNSDDIPNHNNPLRSYYCSCCCAWHITKSLNKEIYRELDGLTIDEIHVFSKRFRLLDY